MRLHGRWTALAGQTLLNLLLLLQRLDKRLLQSIRVLRLQRLLHIRGDALLANHLGLLVGYRNKESLISCCSFLNYITINLLCFSHFQTGVKSILHWAQRNGAATALAFLFTVR